MRRILLAVMRVSLLLIPLTIHAETEVAGVKLAGSYSLGGQTLELNGAGIRSKFVVKLYVGALYVATTSSDASSLLTSSGPKSMQMYMLYKHISPGKLAKAWREGFEANLTRDELNSLQSRINQFINAFPSLKEGDVVHMNYIPGRGTEVLINGESEGIVDGDRFFPALMKVWIGKEPVDKALKEGLLGDD